VYRVVTVGIGGFRLYRAIGQATFQTVAPVSSLELSAPLPEPLRYGKAALALTTTFRGAEWTLESMILAGRIREPGRWVNVATRATATGQFTLPRELLGSFAIGGIASWHPVPDPEKFYITCPLVWGIGFLSDTKRKHGIHPSGSDFFGTVTIRRQYCIGGILNVAPFVNAGVSILSRLTRHTIEKPHPLYALGLGALMSGQRGRTDIEVAISIPVLRVVGNGLVQIDVLIDQPSLR
jgi:hypothetical protein